MLPEALAACLKGGAARRRLSLLFACLLIMRRGLLLRGWNTPRVNPGSMCFWTAPAGRPMQDSGFRSAELSAAGAAWQPGARAQAPATLCCAAVRRRTPSVPPVRPAGGGSAPVRPAQRRRTQGRRRGTTCSAPAALRHSRAAAARCWATGPAARALTAACGLRRRRWHAERHPSWRAAGTPRFKPQFDRDSAPQSPTARASAPRWGRSAPWTASLTHGSSGTCSCRRCTAVGLLACM